MARTNLGKRLRKHRLLIDVTQTYVAICVGMKTATISAYETGRIMPSKEMVAAILAIQKPTTE